MEFLTVFTPTYNRKERIRTLYDSLRRQVCKEFVWLIVDDGSSDGTGEYIAKIRETAPFAIEYFFQTNSGKSSAHNKGVELTRTPLFTCVDSDDYLIPDCVGLIKEKWKYKGDCDVGILAFCSQTKMPDTKRVVRTTLKNAYDHLRLRGDTMLVYETRRIRRYRFPSFPGEKFVPENYLYDLLDQDGTLLLLPDVLYVAEYFPDGYTHCMSRVIKNNPFGYIAYIEQRLRFDKGLKNRFLDMIRYIAILRVVKKSVFSKQANKALAFFAYPFGVLLYLKKYRAERNCR